VVLLRPYIGLGGLVVGAIVAYILRPIVYALLSASAGEAESEGRSEDGEAKQNESIPSNHVEQKGDTKNGT